jgi:outer membrane protein TolC
VAERQLTKELGRRIFIPMKADGAFEVKDPCGNMPDLDNIADTNPLLRQLIAKREAAKFGLKSAYADFSPQIYVNGSMGNSGTNPPPDKNEWSIGTSVTFPFFDGGNRFAQVSQAKAVLGQAVDDERSGRDGVIYTLANTWNNLQNAVDKVAVQKEYLEAAIERARISDAEYGIGLLSYDNWIIIENNLVAARKSLVSAEADALIAEANWIQAKGGTLDYDQEE